MKCIIPIAFIFIALVSCSKEEEQSGPIYTDNKFFYFKISWGGDSLVSYERIDTRSGLPEGPAMYFASSPYPDTGWSLILWTYFMPNTGYLDPHITALKKGIDMKGNYNTPYSSWLFASLEKDLLYSVSGTEKLSVDKISTHAQWGRYAEGTLSFQGYHMSDTSMKFNVTGVFRLRTV